MNKIFNVGLIGCGHIAETYFRAHKYFNNFKIIKCADINHKAALKCAAVNKIKAASIKEILNDKKIKVILNLTIPEAHYSVARLAISHGKHVYSEKPLAINLSDGINLIKLAKKRNCILETLQTHFWVAVFRNQENY